MFKSDKSFKVLAYLVSIIFSLAIIYPLVYIVSNSLKDNNAIYEVPPKLIPKKAESITFIVDYSDHASMDDKELEETILRDNVRAFYGGLDELKNNAVYEYKYVAMIDEEVIYSSRAHKMLLELERDFGIYSSTNFNEKTLMHENRYIRAMGEVNKKFKPDLLLKDIKATHNNYDSRLKENLGEKYEFDGQIVEVRNEVKNLLHLESFVYYHKLPSYAYPKNPRIVKYSFFAFMGNTVIVILWAMLTQTILCSMAAYAISNILGEKWANMMMIFFLGTTMIPVVSILLPQLIMFKQMGFYNNYAALLLPYLLPFGFYVFLFRGFFDRLPRSLFEAAKIDGASDFYVYSRIAMPLSKPIISLIALQTFLSNWNDYLWAYMVTERQELWTLNVALYNLSNNQAIKQNFIMGLSVLTIIPVLLLTITFSSKVKQSIASAGIKG